MSSTASLPAYLLPGVPVYQPPHLEGDASFATEILPGPPPVNALQPALVKRDPKKPAIVYSYLPSSDPGTTYSGIMHGTLIGQDSASPRKRAQVEKSLASGRAQRASARSQNATGSTAEVSSNDIAEAASSSADPESQMVTENRPPLSRSNSIQSVSAIEVKSSTGPGRPRRRDKGKAKEVESVIRIKEEPKVVSLHTPEPLVSNLLNNNDHCSACRSSGALVYCDGCPRAFHLWCLDPPMESIDEGDSTWFCPACMVAKCPPRKPPPGLLSPLIQLVDTSIPTEYQLPDDIRNFFKDVTTGPKGAYVDTSEIKQPRLNRHGQLEDRDAHRLRDRNGQPVLCFRCGTSALPENVAAAAPATKRARKVTPKALQYEVWKDIISCDYCNLHWHLDCLDPPLSTMPNFTKKWMCPNHAEKIVPSKHRIPKQNATPIDITKSSQWNNGNIEILESDILPAADSQKKVAVDEVLINGRRYRIPERIVLLDFWNRVSKKPNTTQDTEDASGLSSPLTDLSSLSDEDVARSPVASTSNANRSPHDLEVAQMLFDFCKGKSSSNEPSVPNGVSRKPSQTLVLPPPEPAPVIPAKPRVVKAPSPQKRDSNPKLVNVTAPPTLTETPTLLPSPVFSVSVSAAAAPRRKRSTNNVQPEPSTRQLRSRSRRGGNEEEESVSTPPLAAVSQSKVRVKLEEVDSSLSLFNGSTTEVGPSAPLKPTRSRAKKKDVDVHAEKPEKEKKSRKRKEREDDAYVDNRERTEKAKEKREKVKATKRQVPPSAGSLSSLSTLTMTPSTPAPPTTPSLKIRIPRLTLNGSPAIMTTPKASTTTTTSTRLS